MATTSDNIPYNIARFSAYNRRRLRVALSRLSSEGRALFHVVPLLLHSQWQHLDDFPNIDAPSGIINFHLRSRHRKAHANLLPEMRLVDAPPTAPFIQLLTLMGSIGSIAQTQKSDFDFNIFIDKQKLSNEALANLQKKLTLIENWSINQVGQEVHFFISNIADFRNNNFGVTDKENVGSAGGTLFKDEFYRTMVSIAGYPPIWFVTPPGLANDAAADYQTKVNTYTRKRPIGFIDIGHIHGISSAEFFGAALWQMNKALGSPLKSVLKMALLEYYLLDPEAELLCEKLQQSMRNADASSHDFDPYLCLVNELDQYYSKADASRTQEIRLVRAAFLYKLGLSAAEIDHLLEDDISNQPDKEASIVTLLHRWGWTSKDFLELESELTQSYYNFSETEHNQLAKFFLKSYTRLSKWLQKTEKKTVAINAEDMTVLGRKLFAHYESRPGKISVKYSKTVARKVPPKLSIICYQEKGNNYCELYDFHFGKKRSRKILKMIGLSIQKKGSLFNLLAWLIVNNLYTPETKLEYKNTLGSATPDEIRQILLEMHIFFIQENTQIEPSRSDYLRSKKILCALAIPNFDVTTMPDDVVYLDFVIADSWGEYTHSRMRPKDAFNFMSRLHKHAQSKEKALPVKLIVLPMQSALTNIKMFQNFANS